MAKNDKKIETAQEKIARLQAEMQAAQIEVAAEETARNEKIAGEVRKLTATFGVATLADVISLIKQVEKGTLGKLDATARGYVKLTEEQKTSIKARLAKGEQVSTLANEFGVSSGTVYNLKKDKGDEVAPVAIAAS